jgi:hypothetical protein
MITFQVHEFDDEMQWQAYDVTDFENVVVTLEGTWTGDVTLWGTNDEPEFTGDYNWVKWSLNDSTGVSSTTLVSTVTGGGESEVTKGFRGSVAGLRSFAIYTEEGFTGAVRAVISYQRSAK